MAAYVKYTMVFKDDFGRTVHVVLRSAEVVLEPIVLTAASNPVTITMVGGDDDVYQPVITSQAVIRIILPEDSVQLFEDLTNMTEDTFGVTITVFNPGDDYVWHGWLIPDEQIRNFSYTGQEISIRAIDPLSRSKGVKLLNSDNKYLYGKFKLKDIISTVMDRCFNPDNTVGTFSYFVASTLKLSYDTTYVFPDILEQLTVNTEVFNDDMGRPITGFEVIKMIANSLCMRCWYENRTLYFQDIHTFTSNWMLGAIGLGIMLPGDDNNFLIKNTENITTLRTFKESRARFEYKGAVGILIDGYLQNWEVAGAGFRLTDWDYNPILGGQPDVFLRREGTGREGTPYGIRIQAYSSGNIERIGSRSVTTFTGGDSARISIKMQLLNPNDIPPYQDEYVIDISAIPVIYNPDDPTLSYITQINPTTNETYWQRVDLTGTLFASGVTDWAAITALTPRAIFLRADRAATRQTLEKDTPPLPVEANGILFVNVSPAINPSYTLIPDSTKTIIHNVLVSKIPKNTERVPSKGEIVYITRQINTSQLDKTKDIELNTTVNNSVTGALETEITYVRTSDGVTVLAGLVTYLSNGSFLIDKSLLQYNAMVQMRYNYAQYKIDLEARSRLLQFYNFISLADLSDPLRPSTAIYDEPFLQTKHEYDIKTGLRKLSVVSMKQNARLLSETTLDDTHDLLEVNSLTR